MLHLPDLVGLKMSFDAIVTKAVKVLPRAAIEIAGKIPDPINRRVTEHFLNKALQQPLAAGEFDFLCGHTVTIHILDADWSITITALENRRLCLPGTKGGETKISATAKDFVGLAAGHTDPDTLFFQRRLRIEGNVALGLETKNTLDGVDHGSLPVPLKAILQLTRVWLSRYESLSAVPSQPPPRLSSPARPYQ